MVSFTPRLLQLWPDTDQSAGKASVADEGIRQIKLRRNGMIYFTIDLLLLLSQINHLFPSTGFLIFRRNSRRTNYGACGVMRDVCLEDMRVIALTLDVGSLWSNAVEVSDRRGLSSLSAGLSPKSGLIRLTGQYMDSTGPAKAMWTIILKTMCSIFHVFLLICMIPYMCIF